MSDSGQVGFSTYVFIVLLVCIGHALIFSGITFLSGQLLPDTLGGLYRTTPLWLKLFFFALLVSIPANLLFSYAYKIAGASFAGVTYASAVVLGGIIVALLVDGIKLNLSIALGATIMLAGAVWVNIALNSAR